MSIKQPKANDLSNTPEYPQEKGWDKHGDHQYKKSKAIPFLKYHQEKKIAEIDIVAKAWGERHAGRQRNMLKRRHPS